ncbi:hypothetical protein NEMBOFW57_001044 [Staphylotrichum longicolle]|uniref:Autophagy-related protein 27 n=1 Tax=Staphylotrichum longicolle TaxID=669026 RepID=A0AAD4F1L4_9PEZI|nr:hypothetical protein NEMBOFW57_001044 [Staphylotrichum longicolle]
MHPQTSSRGLLLAIAALGGVSAADHATTTKTASTSTPVVTPCVATATSGAFFDLRPDTAVVYAEGEKHVKGVPTEDYVARGWDYGSNFTLNVCNAVVKKVTDVVGVERSLWKNVSAYYETKGKVYSLGQQSGDLTPRGRKLVLQYTGGSPCGSSDKSKDKRARAEPAPRRTSKDDDDDDDEDDDKKDKAARTRTRAAKTRTKKKKKKRKKKEKTLRRKSATISFLCDRDPTRRRPSPSSAPTRTTRLRGRRAAQAGQRRAGSVFAIIFFIAVLVYVVGGVFYQRTVAHARWRQLPNYSLWSGIWSFVKDLFIILTSSCARLIPRRRGYHTLSGSPTGRHRNRDDENRLIDQLDEEWDD